jgi:atypical dual specificity phosphatase
LPFYAFRYLSLLLQSFGKEEPISQVTDKIFIGQRLLWFHKKVFNDKKIKAVLNITIEDNEPHFVIGDKSIQYLRVPVLDKTSPSMKQLDKGVKWGLEQISQGRSLYVHCSAGHERSATFVVAMLLKMGDCKALDEAVEKIRCVRPKARFVGNQKETLGKWFDGC